MKRNPIGSAAAYLAASLLSLAMVFPFLWMISSSLKPTRDIFADTLRLVPKTATLGAYAMSRNPRLPGFRTIERLFLVSIMYPYILLMTPVYVVMFKLGLLGTRLGIVLFLALGPIQYFLFREFFSKVPKAVIESAQMDGAGEFQTFVRIIAPMAKPVFMTALLLGFIINWDNWFPVLVISTSMKTYTLPVALFNLDSQLEVNFPEIMALSTVVSLPVMIVFILTQRKVIAGFAAGSIKG